MFTLLATQVHAQQSAASSSLAEKTVRIIYLIPSDKSENPAYKQALADASRHVQAWYRDQLGTGKTFRLHDPVVEVHETSHEAGWYSTNQRADFKFQFWGNVRDEAFLLTGGDHYDPDNQWIYYIDAHAACGQVSGGGTSSVAIIHANDLLGFVGQPEIPVCPLDHFSFPPCRYVGGMAHELGHALGLPHPPGCDMGEASCERHAMMYEGYSSYPNTYFREDDKDSLNISPFIEMIDIAEAPRECSEIGFPFAPNTLDPSNGAAGVARWATLRWHADPASESYSVQVSTDMSFLQTSDSRSKLTAIVFDTTGVADTTVVVPDLAYGTTYFWRVQGENDAGVGSYSNVSSFSTTSGVATEPTDAIATFELEANYPNPFRGSTTIGYTLQQASHVGLTVYDAYGRLVRRLIDGFGCPGRNEATFHSGDLADGVYFLRLETEGLVSVRSMTLLR